MKLATVSQCCPKREDSVILPDPPPSPRYRPGAIYGRGVMQRLLLQPQYWALQDIVLVEGRFVEIGNWAQGLRLVYLALTPDHVIMAERGVLTPKEWEAEEEDDDEEEEDDDEPGLPGLELVWAAPLVVVGLGCLPGKFVLKLQPGLRPCRYFELCSQPRRYRVWGDWCEKVDLRFKDPGQDYHGHRPDRLANFFGDRRFGHPVECPPATEQRPSLETAERPEKPKEKPMSWRKKCRAARRHFLKHLVGKEML